MTSYYYDNQVPVYRNVSGTTSLTLDSTNNELIIENTTIPKKIIINSTQFSNGTQSLPYTQMYETINACQACVYPQSANVLTINDTLIADNGSGDTANLNTTSLILDSNTGTNQFSFNNNSSITSTQSISLSPTGELINNGTIIQNNGGYIQSISQNFFNPTTIISNVECFIINNATNPVIMDTFSNFLYGGVGGWTCKIINQCGSSVNITSPDAVFTSWLRGVVGSSYTIPNNSCIQVTALDPSITGTGFNEFFVEDCSGYKTIGTTANATHYINFSDSSSTGVGNIQKTSGLQFNPSTDILTLTDGTNTLNIGPTSNPATSLQVTSDNSNTNCYIPFTKTTAGNDTFFIDDTTGPLTYNPSTATLSCTVFNGSASTVSTTLDNSSANTGYIVFTEANAGTGRTLYTADTTKILSYAPSTGTLSTTQMSCAVINQPATSSTCTLWNGLTTGSVSIASNAQTTGSITIGSTTTTTGLCNVRPPLVLARQLRTTNSATYPPTNVLDLGYQASTLGASFTTTALSSSTNTNLMSYSFTSANYGTYIFNCAAIITPTDTTAVRQVELSISTASATIQNPYYDMEFIPIFGSAPQLRFTRMLQIYADTTVYLVGYCNGSAANVQTTSNNGLFSYTRIA